MKIDRASGQLNSESGYGNDEIDFRTTLKQTLLLATAIFLISAPAPDSSDIAELSANFIVTTRHSATPPRDADQPVSMP